MISQGYPSRLVFKKICYDTKKLNFLPMSFFQDEGAHDSNSILDMHESALFSFLFNSDITLKRLIANHFIQSGNIRYGLEQDNIFGSKPGDIDLILFDEHYPQHAVAAEVKRIKIRATLRDDPDQMNKMFDLKKGFLQANSLCSLSFHRVYLIILIAVDGQLRTNNNTLMRGEEDNTFNRIQRFVYERLKSEGFPIGVVFIRIEQPTNRAVEEQGNIGICTFREAPKREQSSEISGKLENLRGDLLLVEER